MFLGPSLGAILQNGLLVGAGYKTFQSLENQSWKTDRHWLTFWVLFSLMQFIEFWADGVLHKVPAYYELKLMFIAYLAMGGANALYDSLGRPCFHTLEQQCHALSNQPTVRKSIDSLRTQKDRVQHKFQAQPTPANRD